MKKFSLFIFTFLSIFILSSCEKTDNKVSVTYKEATPVYGDLEAVRNQPLMQSIRTVENPGKIYVGSTFILLGEENAGIHLINNTDIDNPQFAAFIHIPGNKEFFVKGNTLYAESYYDLLKIDISDPQNAQLLARAENVFQETLTNDKGEALLGFTFEEIQTEISQDSDLYQDIMEDQMVYYDFARQIIPLSALPSSFAGNSSEQFGTVNRITSLNDYVYIINANKMAVVDDSNGEFTQVATNNTITFPDFMETIFPYENHLFVGSRSSMNIYDASNPVQPVEVFEFEHATSCDPVLPSEGVVYVTLRTADFSPCPGDINALLVLDIEDLASTKQLEEISMQSPFGMSIIGEKLFIGEGDNGLSVFDISNKQAPQLLRHEADIPAYDIIAHPNNPNVLLIAGEDGLSQYTFDNALDLSIRSRIDY